MTEHRYPREEIARRGNAIFEPIRAELKREHDGKCVAIDIETGFYAVDAQAWSAAKTVRAMNPDAEVWLVRIGKDNVTKFGWRGFLMFKRSSNG